MNMCMDYISIPTLLPWATSAAIWDILCDLSASNRNLRITIFYGSRQMSAAVFV